jgi:putative CocE/NonD family hydrolase
MPVTWAADTWMDPGMYGLVPADVEWSVRPLDGLIAHVHGGRRCASAEQWRATGEEDALWTEGLFGCADPASRLEIPALHVGGWFDVFHRGQLDDWATARASSCAPQLLVMDATDHAHCAWSAEPPGPVDLHSISDAEIEAFMPAYLSDTVAFYECVLKGRDGPGLPGVRWRLTGDDWHVADRWPPAEAQPLTLHLAGGARALAGVEGGALAATPEASVQRVSWTHDPSDPVPSLLEDELQTMAAPPDDRAVEARPDVLTFTSEPFAAGLDLAGPVVAGLMLSSSASSTHAMAKLVDVAPDGTTRRLGEGAALLRDARSERCVAVRVGSVGYRLLPGHRLRLEVASSAFPQHPPHPGTEHDPWTANAMRATEQRLRTGGPEGSRLCVTALTAAAQPPQTITGAS